MNAEQGCPLLIHMAPFRDTPRSIIPAETHTLIQTGWCSTTIHELHTHFFHESQQSSPCFLASGFTGSIFLFPSTSGLLEHLLDTPRKKVGDTPPNFDTLASRSAPIIHSEAPRILTSFGYTFSFFQQINETHLQQIKTSYKNPTNAYRFETDRYFLLANKAQQARPHIA